ncbi:MAG: hypothetical protein EXS05_12570 [Planctomycetaceae bacterium]|nr:hypothetical protein [Planctomycetaceae bacterium]
MRTGAVRGDLVILAADLDTESALRGLLSRPEALGIRPLAAQIYRHPGRDPGCRTQAHEYLRSFCNQYDHALVVFDREGCGRERISRVEIEQDIERLLSSNGWESRAAVVVIDPELENWVWSDSPHVDAVCGWSGKSPALRNWLIQRGFLNAGNTKPAPPKQAFREALREVRKQPSASLFTELANRVSLARCSDPAFQKMKSTLQTWFPKLTP